MLLSIQPFSLRDSIGGAVILRKLFEPRSDELLCVCIDPREGLSEDSPHSGKVAELHFRSRMRVGPLENTRFGRYLPLLERQQRFRNVEALLEICEQRRITALHCVAHDSSLILVTHLAKRTGLPLFLSVHDDIRYTMMDSVVLAQTECALAWAWQNAAECFAISEPLATEYCRRFGARSSLLITSGVSRDELPAELNSAISKLPSRSLEGGDQLKLYFAGLFHHHYRGNLQNLLSARESISSLKLDLHFRCGELPAIVSGDEVRVSSFSSSATVKTEIAAADLLYFPLPFDPKAAALGKYSLSTKLVEYLGSGVPILYHGPDDTYAGKLLAEHDAALCWTDNKSETLRRLVNDTALHREVTVKAMKLARTSFSIDDVRQRFWESIESFLIAPSQSADI